MRSIRKRITALVLAIVTLFLVSVPVYAAREEEFISEVALVYEDSVEDAKKAIEGTDWKLLEYDLNANADVMFDDGVYLIFKTSTNVEDAITDLRVMDMYGGYNTVNYEQQLKESRDAYMKGVSYIRIAAAEFRELYKAGDEMAKIAYRQMNYYKDTDTNKLMGDFMLNIPSDDALVTVLMEGNAYVVTNLISLLAVGISGGNNGTLADRIAANYDNKDAYVNSVDYYNVAKMFIDKFTEFGAIVKRYNALADQYDLTDEDISEEEYAFIADYASVAEALAEIPYGEGTLKDFVAKDGLTVEDICPIVAAFTEGQLALSDIGVLSTVIQYSSPKPIDKLNELLAETERELKDESGNIKTIDVYLGVDRTIFDGDFAFTSNAERQQALTGYKWDLNSATDRASLEMDKVATYLALSGILVSFVPYLVGKVAVKVGASAVFAVAKSGTAATFGQQAAIKIGYFFCGGKTLGTAGASAVFLAVGIGLVLAAVGVAAFSKLYGYYNPDYTAIPNTMIDVRETDIGDKYIKYTAAKVYGDKEGKNADFNAYQGNEWIALYYTKDATAGNSLLANFSFSETSNTVARRYQGVSMFGEDKAFNLNSHVFSNSAKGAYLTVRYSTTKKAAADVPAVVGSVFGEGAIYALTAIGGAAIGAGVAFGIISYKKKKNDTPAEEASAEA